MRWIAGKGSMLSIHVMGGMFFLSLAFLLIPDIGSSSKALKG